MRLYPVGMQNVQTTCPDTRPASAYIPPAGTPAGSAEFLAWLEHSRLEVEHHLSEHLRALESQMQPHSRLPDAVQYAMSAGGMRLRPILVLEACRVCGGRVETAVPAALAMEFIHTFSLVHDDLPAMDNDDLRRGKPTCHKVYGDAGAILAGDWLAVHAFELVANCPVDAPTVQTLVKILARGTEHMIEGQGADVEGEGKPPSEQLVNYIHRHKTAALIETCCRLGAACARVSNEVVEHLARYGQHLGIAFQIADDMLDETSTSEQLGKTVGKDAAVSKQTYPAVFGLEESDRQAVREMGAALAALEVFGGRADRLRALARYVVRRDH